MRKLFLALFISIAFLAGCTSTQKYGHDAHKFNESSEKGTSMLFEGENKKYKVDYHGQMSRFSGAKENYAEGTEIEISYSFISTDTDYIFYVDGQEVNAEWNDKKGYIIRFNMPAHDIEVYCIEKNSKAN